MKKTADEVANEAIMTRQGNQTLIILVEGFNDDKVFSKFLADPETEIICSWGKENVLSATNILEEQNIFGFLAIVDADFWHIDGHPPISENVLVTDHHDVEMMMMKSRSFEHFVTEVCSKAKLSAFLKSHGVTDIREILINLALPLGCLRRYALLSDISLCFEGLKFSTFIEKETLGLDLERMVKSVLYLTKNPGLHLKEIVQHLIHMVQNLSDDPYHICCGHDVIAILGVGLRKCIGSKSKEAASQQMLESALRLSYDSKCFRDTQLYAAALRWSERNAPYRPFA